MRVHTAKQVQDSLVKFKALDPNLIEECDLSLINTPKITIVTLHNLCLNPPTKEDHALMLDGFTVPLQKLMRSLEWDYVRNLHGQEGLDRWVRTYPSEANLKADEFLVAKEIHAQGWDVDMAELDFA